MYRIDQNPLNRIGKRLASPLSRVISGPTTADHARTFESYWGILLGKGAGSGWAIDAEIVAALAVLDTDEPTLFDVGSNKGEWSAGMYERLGGGRYFLFEPQAACLPLLHRLELGEKVVVPRAVSSATGPVLMHSDAATSGVASLHARRDSFLEEREFVPTEVEATTIDDVIRDHAIATVDFMKMDIEGHELAALEGATDSLARGVIRALSFEFGSGNINSRTFFRDFWDLLTPLGYRLFRVLPSGRLLRIDAYYEDCEHFRGVTNYVATRTP